MSKLTLVSAAQMSKILRHLGFILKRQKGSHAYFQHPDGRATVVPIHRGENLGRGLIRAILRDIEIAPEEYEKLLKDA